MAATTLSYLPHGTFFDERSLTFPAGSAVKTDIFDFDNRHPVDFQIGTFLFQLYHCGDDGGATWVTLKVKGESGQVAIKYHTCYMDEVDHIHVIRKMRHASYEIDTGSAFAVEADRVRLQFRFENIQHGDMNRVTYGSDTDHIRCYYSLSSF